MGKCASLYRTVCRNGNLQNAIERMFLQADMAASLSDDYETGALEHPNDTIEG